MHYSLIKSFAVLYSYQNNVYTFSTQFMKPHGMQTD